MHHENRHATVFLSRLWAAIIVVDNEMAALADVGLGSRPQILVKRPVVYANNAVRSCLWDVLADRILPRRCTVLCVEEDAENEIGSAANNP